MNIYYVFNGMSDTSNAKEIIFNVAITLIWSVLPFVFVLLKMMSLMKKC